MQGDVGSLLLERVRDLAALLLLVDQLPAHAQHLRVIGGGARRVRVRVRVRVRLWVREG